VRRTSRYIAVAEVARPHGIRGELRCKLYHEGSSILAGRAQLRLRFPDGTERDAAVANTRPAGKAALVKFAGIDDRTTAEAMRKVVLCVPRDELPPPDDGEFYACDLEGARAVLASGEEIGRVSAVESYPTCDAIVIDRGAAGSLQVPLTDAYILSIDTAEGIVRITSLDGLD
jgi:16S rRNA processing protein RimM